MTINVPPPQFRPAAIIACTRIDDPGFDSPEEIAAVKAIEGYARSTGPQGGNNSVVRMFGRNMNKVIAFVSPDSDPSFKLLVMGRRSLWAFADQYDISVPKPNWMRLDAFDPGNTVLTSHIHAVRADKIIRGIFPQFSEQRNG